jgi:large subunit ribosomal protein L29
MIFGARRVSEEYAMKPAEYRGMSDEQLDLSMRDLVKNLFHLRFQSATERLETPSELLKARRELARIKTIQRERQLAREKAAPQGSK